MTPVTRSAYVERRPSGRAVDKGTVQMTLLKPFAALLQIRPWIWVVSKDEVQTNIGSDDGQTYLRTTIAGSGPFKVRRAQAGALYELERPAGDWQAGTSSRIENYLGFPTGLSGGDLSRRAITQATRFGVELLSPQSVERIELKETYKVLHLKDGSQVKTKSIVIGTGVDYRKLEGGGIQDFTGAGVYYGAATTEAANCRNKQVYIVGGGNSAGTPPPARRERGTDR